MMFKVNLKVMVNICGKVVFIVKVIKVTNDEKIKLKK